MIRYSFVFALLFHLCYAPGAHAAPPVLLLLEHTESGKTVLTKVELKAGVVESKDKGKPRAKWIIRPGDALTANVRPGDRAVLFYQTTGGTSVLLFIVKARYYADADGKWVPQFQLNEEPMVMRGPDGRWKPLTTIQGIPSLIVQTGTEHPNAEGYKKSIELAFTTATTSIDAWVVQ